MLSVPRVAFRDELGEVADNFTRHLVPEERTCVDFRCGFLAVTSHGSESFAEVPSSLRGGPLRCMLQKFLRSETVVLGSR